MNCEADQVPSGSLGNSRSSGTTYYLCAECSLKMGIASGGAVRCTECGHRVLSVEGEEVGFSACGRIR